MGWICSNCETKNHDSHTVCIVCDSQRPKESIPIDVSIKKKKHFNTKKNTINFITTLLSTIMAVALITTVVITESFEIDSQIIEVKNSEINALKNIVMALEAKRASLVKDGVIVVLPKEKKIVATDVIDIKDKKFVLKVDFPNNESCYDKTPTYGVIVQETYRIIVDCNKRILKVTKFISTSESLLVRSDLSTNMNITRGEKNTLKFILLDNIGYIFINDIYINSFNVEKQQGKMPLKIAANFYDSESVIGGEIVIYKNLSIIVLN